MLRHLSSAQRTPRLALLAGLALACRGAPVAPATSEPAELVSLRAPAFATGDAFAVTATFGRGACQHLRFTNVRSPDALSVRADHFIPDGPGTGPSVCTLQLVPDSVVVPVTPPYALPFTIRVARGGLPDTVVVVRRGP